MTAQRGARAAAQVAPSATMALTEAPEAAQGPTKWVLWFPVRLGPMRKVTRMILGTPVTVKRQMLELPPNANDRTYWRLKAPWLKEWRKAARHQARAAHIPAYDRVRISSVIYRRTLGKADADGDLARLKPLVDGLVDANVVPDDRRQFVEYAMPREERAGRDGPGILLIIEPAASAAAERAGREGE